MPRLHEYILPAARRPAGAPAEWLAHGLGDRRPHTHMTHTYTNHTTTHGHLSPPQKKHTGMLKYAKPYNTYMKRRSGQTMAVSMPHGKIYNPAKYVMLHRAAQGAKTRPRPCVGGGV